MPPLVITKESLYKRITELERKHCCNKNQFFDTFADFPAEGAAGVLYIDKETGIIYIWDSLNSVYKVAEYIIEITYSELSTLITNSELIPGQKYLLSDYQTVHTIPTTADLNTGLTEPLIVTALSSNELEPIAFSTLYPNDIIYYHHENGNTLFPGSTKGYISRRIDTLYNNSIGNDFRNCKYRRYKLNVTTEWDGVTAFNQLAVVKKTGTEEIYIALKANTNVALTETGTWVRHPYNNATYNGHPTSGLVNVPYDSLDYQDQYLFRIDYNISSNHTYNNLINYRGLYDTVVGLNFQHNLFSGEFVGNTIGDSFSRNSCNGYYADNVHGSTNNTNTFIGNFYNNNLGNQTFRNTFSGPFDSNIIGNDCQENTFGPWFKNNKIGNSFQINSIGADFDGNTVGKSFKFNTIGLLNTGNVMADNFKQTTTNSRISSINFTSATHVYGEYSKTIVKVPDGSFRLSYIDNAGVQQIVLPTA